MKPVAGASLIVSDAELAESAMLIETLNLRGYEKRLEKSRAFFKLVSA